VAGSSFTDNLRQFANEIGLQSFSGAAAAPNITISPVHVDKIYSGPSETSNDSDAILTTNAISGITVACVLICALFLFVYFFFYHQRKGEQKVDESSVGDILIDYSAAHPMTEGSVSVVDDIPETVRESLTKYSLRTSFFGVGSGDIRQSVNPLGRDSMNGDGSSGGGGNTLIRFLSSKTESFKAATSGVISSVQKFIRSDKSSIAVDPTTAKKKEAGKASNVMSLSFDGPTLPFDSLTTDEVCKLLNKIGMGKYTSLFIENGVNGSILCEITSPEDLKDCSIYMPGPVARSLLSSIKDFKEKGVPVDLLV